MRVFSLSMFGMGSGVATSAAAALILAGCSHAADTTSTTTSNTTQNTTVVANAVAPDNATVAAAPAAGGFDPASAPMGQAPTGAWPYVSLIDGYEPLSIKNMPGNSARELTRDVAYDRYEFFDGARLIPVQGRLYTTMALGKGASIFQAEKTYEKLIHDLGGVTVWEGSGQEMVDKKVKFTDQRHRGAYELGSEKGGVYMVRTPTGALWIEVWKRWEDSTNDSYWLTVVEQKDLVMKAKMLDAEAMKAALDAQGHVALYINFDTDKTAIKPESLATIAEIVKLLNANPGLRIEVQGHTDNAGTPPHNQTLSEGRAQAVVGSLIAQGIAADRLTAKGYGQTKPIAGNASEDGKAKNRRVELVKK